MCYLFVVESVLCCSLSLSLVLSLGDVIILTNLAKPGFETCSAPNVAAWFNLDTIPGTTMVALTSLCSASLSLLLQNLDVNSAVPACDSF